MVLEELIDAIKAENKPMKLFFYGVILSTVAIFLSLWIFRTYSSLIMVFLITMGALPLIYVIIKNEEEKDLTDLGEKLLLKEHAKALNAFMYLFVGITFTLAFWYAVLPSGTVSILFNSQTSTIQSINGNVTGQVSNSLAIFSHIFLNNLKVMVFCILFSFLYGAGAMFILTWNASVIGTAIGNFIRSNLALAAELAGLPKVAHYFQTIAIGLLKYAIHGIPEILAYFTAGLAGGIISVAVIRHDFGSRKFEHIVLDSADLLILSLVILFVAAFLEVYVTPLVF
ncbi:stage II sporulation protein M [Candidatus Woesearchaeota archaeon]|nr:MAG: stage II sporulation protein M [Candidatus Woesearchaeota archaeon]